MNNKIFNKIENHYNNFFMEKEEPKVFHPITENGDLHIDILLYSATNKFPYQVLATIGASDYKMKGKAGNLSNFNEYLMFLDKDCDLTNQENKWNLDFLMYIARYAYDNNSFISYCHSIDCFASENESYGADNNMRAGYLMLPMAVPDISILRLKVELFKTITFLQAMPITQKEMNEHLDNPANLLEETFYNENENNTDFLTKKYR